MWKPESATLVEEEWKPKSAVLVEPPPSDRPFFSPLEESKLYSETESGLALQYKRMETEELDKWSSDDWKSRIPDYEKWLLSPEEQRKALAELPARKARIEDDTQYMYSEEMWGMRGAYKKLYREQLAEDETRIKRGAKPMTVSEKLKRKWTSPETILASVIPFNPLSAAAEKEAYETHQRLENGLSKDYWSARGQDPEKGFIRDTRYRQEYFKAQAERMFRSETTWAQIATGVAIMPKWMMEFYLSGKAAAEIGGPVANKVGKLLGKVIKNEAGRKAVGDTLHKLGMAMGRTAVQIPSLVEGTYQKIMPQLGLGPEGEFIFKDGHSGLKAFLYAAGGLYIENLTEDMGTALMVGLRKVPLVGRVMGKVDDILSARFLATHPGSTVDDYWRIVKAGGYDGLVGEGLEEDLAKVLNALAGTEDYGTGKTGYSIDDVLARLVGAGKAIKEGKAVETVVLSVPTALGMGGRAATRAVYALGLDKKSRQFKEFALTKDGSEIVAAMSPGVAAEIATKEQPSRADLKRLGVAGWNAAERKRLAALFTDALADQERMTTNQRAIEQAQEAVARQERGAERAAEGKTARERAIAAQVEAEEAEPPKAVTEEEPKPKGLDLEAMDQDELEMALEVTEGEPDQEEFHERLLAEQKRRGITEKPKEEITRAEINKQYRELNTKWGEEKVTEAQEALSETEKYAEIEDEFFALDEAGKGETPEANILQAQLFKMVDEYLTGKGAPVAKPAEKVTPGKRFYTFDVTEEKFVEAKKATLVKLEEFPELDLFVWKEGATWYINEGKTGTRIGEPKRTKKKVIEQALDTLTRNKDKIEEAIQRTLERTGLSPRYTEAAEAPAEEKPKKKGLKKKPIEAEEEEVLLAKDEFPTEIGGGLESDLVIHTDVLLEAGKHVKHVYCVAYANRKRLKRSETEAFRKKLEELTGRKWKKDATSSSIFHLVEAAPAAEKPKKKGLKEKPTKPKKKSKAEAMQALKEHYTPGNIVYGAYWKKHDRVIAFKETDGGWQVTVQEVEKQDGKWVAVGDERTHMTAPSKGDKVVERAAAKPTPEAEQSVKLMNNVTALLQSEAGPIDNRKVDSMAREVFGAAAGKARAAYDAFEAGMNKYIMTNIPIDEKQGFDALQQLEQQMPRQTRRDDVSVEYQQFSTPPTEAYVVVRAAAIKPGMSVLEPSAGTGNIAILAREFSEDIETNEIDDRRRTLLEALGFKTMNINAEQLDNLLAPDKMYDVVVMNPPFSATGGRVTAHSTKVGARHVQQALLRVKKGGRLVAIVGEGMALDRVNFRDWWARIEEKYNVRANIGMAGKYYGKFGTTFGNQIVIIDNTGKTESEGQIVTGADLSPTAALALLDSISREDVHERIKRAGEEGDRGPGPVAGPEPGPGPAAGGAAAGRGRKPKPTEPGGPVRPGVGEVSAARERRKGLKPAGKERERRAPEGPRAKEGVGRGVGGVGVGRVPGLSQQEQQELDKAFKDLRKKLSEEEGISYAAEPVKKGRKRVPLNPQILMAGIKAGVLLAESNVKSYDTWSKSMVDGVGVRISPYLKRIYQSIRNKYPQYNLQSDEAIKKAEPDETVQVEKEAEIGAGLARELEGSVFSEYHIQKAIVKGAQKHPAKIVESTVMASVEPPDVSYKHHLPSEVITEGRISDIQLEAVIYAGQAHSTVMANGERAGYWVGDGTGLGKGREIYSIIYDNYMQGRKKAVHISVTHQLAVDAQRDSDDVGQPLKIIHQNPSMKDTEVIQADEGVLFTTYGMASYHWDKDQKRYKQLIEWLGPDFDGVIAFDESHKMKNAAVSGRGDKLSMKEGTAVGNMGIDLQRRYPNARVMYVSATGGSEARHLVPYERLGMWGPRLPFEDFIQFTSAVQAGGVNGMETFARDLKQIGRLGARTISYEGVDTSQPIEYKLSEAEKQQYDRVAAFWSVLNRAWDEANENAGSIPMFTSYFATQQSFFLQLMMGYELPTMIKTIEKDLAEDKSVVISLFNTGEAVANRIVADALKEGVPLAEIELSPRQMLVDLVKRHFPLQQYEKKTDRRTGKTVRVPLFDAAGNPVLNRENIRLQEELLSQIADFTLPTNPLDALMEHFGSENVAEVTGRTHRMEKGKYVRRKLKGVKATRLNETETENFQQGKKRIAVISGAGTMGISLHADITKANKQRRSFYALQLSWAADIQMQSFGRVHRSFQQSAPIIRIVSVDLAGQQRLVNAISRRLAALGAITKGERATLSGSMFNTDDLTDTYGKAALTQTYEELLQGQYSNEGLGPVVLQEMGVIDRITGQVNKASQENVDRFLNRIMALPYAMQNRVFEVFYGHYQEIVAKAKETGAFDFGVSDIKAKNIKVVGEPTLVYTHEESGAQTEIFTLEGEVEVEKITFDQATRFASLGFYRNKASKHIYAAQANASPLSTDSNARVMRSVKGQIHTISITDFNNKHEKVLGGEAKTWWDEEFAKMPATRPKTYHLLSGVIYPVYDKIMGKSGLKSKRMRRAKLADGTAVVGMELSTTETVQVKQRFGIGTAFAELTPQAAMALMDDGAQFELDNGWIIKTAQISGDAVLELVAKDPRLEGDTIKSYGFRSEILKFKRRFFELRTLALPVLRKVLAEHKIVRDITSKEGPPGVSYGTVAEAEEEPGEAVSYVFEPAETKAGQKLLGKLRKDAKRSGRKKVGLRSIVNYLNEQLRVSMLVGKTQLTKKYPARYERGPHIIRTKSGVWQLNFHELGHALSAMIDAEKPAWFAHISKMLLEMTGPGTMASVETPEEGMAELCRQYVINPGKIPAQLKQQFESLLNELRPDLLAAFRDTHRAYVYHNNRPYMDRQQSLTYDKPAKGSVEQIANFLWDLGQATIGDSMITHRWTRKIFFEIAERSWYERIPTAGVASIIKGMINKAAASRLKLAREVRKRIESGIADYDSARQAILRIPQEVEAAMSGVKGRLNGITVLAVGEGFGIFSDKELKALTEAGYTLPNVLDPGHGERLYIHPKSFNDIKYDVAGKSKDIWDEFCAYGQGKAELSRWKTKRLHYPGMRTGLEPDKLAAFIAQQEMEHSEWKEHFKAVNEYMDQLLLVPLLTQEKTVAEVIRIKEAWTDYWPLPRQIEGRSIYSGTGTEWSSGIKSAFGSSLPLETLDKAVRMRTRMAFEAYGMHGFLTSLINLGTEIDKVKELPFNAKKLINRIVLELRLDIKKIGQLTEHEEQLVIADYLNKQAADMAGVTVKELKASLQGYKAEDVVVTRNHIDLWRMKKPNAIQVVSKFVGGRRRYYQIPDPQMFKICARGEDIGQFCRFFKNILAPMSKNFRRTVTQLWPFAVGNLALRDSGTVMILGDQKHIGTYLQGLYAAKGLINRITGKHENVFGRSELLSQTLDELTKGTHKTKVESFLGMLAEGIVIKDYSGMTWLERIESLPGQIVAVGLKSIDIPNWLLGSRWASQRSEEITREGGAIAMKKRGASELRTLQAYETVSGNFSQRGRSAHWAAITHMIAFFNPGLQILGQTIEKVTDPDPANRALLIAVKLPWLAAVGGLIAVGRILLMMALHPDPDDQKEIMKQERERPFKDRIGWINIEGVRIPFGYGIPGAVQSYGYNKVMEWFLEDPIPSDVKIKALLVRSNDVPGLSSFLPHVPKTLIELYLNHSFFFDYDIVPNWMLEKYADEPERQAWPNTPLLYKQIGSGLKISPIKLQYAIRGIFTSELNAQIRAIDPRPYDSKSEWPVIGRLITRPAEGFGSQAVQTVQDMDDQWKILRSRVKYLEETEGDTDKVRKFKQQINKLTIAHQVMHEVRALWNDVNAEQKEEKPDYEKIKSRKRLMTEKARKFIKWDMAGRIGKFPAGIVSDEYRRSLIKQRNMRPSPRRKGEPLADYTKRHQKVMDQKRNAAELLKLL